MCILGMGTELLELKKYNTEYTFLQCMPGRSVKFIFFWWIIDSDKTFVL